MTNETYARLAPWLVTMCEAVLLLAALALALLRPGHRHPRKPFVRWFRDLARRKVLACLFVGLSVLGARAALIPILGTPTPHWHDEFSYLLAADTFANGRLTNPTHPMWIHFETFHVLQHPTYMSMYPPAHGLVLAAGQILGNPWIGQWLITGIMCGSLCWALQGWLPPGWALFGSSLAALRLGVMSYWMNEYWAASVVALGGALVFGALPRLKRRNRLCAAILMGIGLVILANTRPYEGALFSIPFAAGILMWIAGKNRPKTKILFSRILLPTAAVLGIGALATCYYYFRVTGHPFLLAYQVNRLEYGRAPYFPWQHSLPFPAFHHRILEEFYRGEYAHFEETRTLHGFFKNNAIKLAQWWQFYLGPGLSLAMLALPCAIRDRKLRLPLAILAIMAVGLAIQTITLPHYFSPATAVLFFVITQSLRHLRLWRWRKRPWGEAAVSLLPLVACSFLILRMAAIVADVPIESPWPKGNLERARVAEELKSTPGKHLVIVTYGPRHDINLEWVWNAADIDAAKTVWARDMGNRGNEELLNYYKDRQVWRIDADDTHPEPRPYN